MFTLHDGKNCVSCSSSTRATAAYGSPWWWSSSRPSVQPHGFSASEFRRGHQFGHLRHSVCCNHGYLCHCMLRHRPPAHRDPCRTPSSPWSYSCPPRLDILLQWWAPVHRRSSIPAQRHQHEDAAARLNPSSCLKAKYADACEEVSISLFLLLCFICTKLYWRCLNAHVSYNLYIHTLSILSLA